MAGDRQPTDGPDGLNGTHTGSTTGSPSDGDDVGGAPAVRSPGETIGLYNGPEPWSLTRYLEVGAQLAFRAPSLLVWRILRLGPISGTFALPLMVGLTALAVWLAGGGDRTGLEATSSLVGGAAAAVAVIGGVAILAVRAVFDALLYGGLRDAATGAGRSKMERIGAGFPGYFILALLRGLVLIGGAMFVLPVLMMIARLAAEHPSRPGVAVGAALFLLVVAGAVAWISLWFALTSASVVWSDGFVPAAMLAAVVAPIREPRVFGKLVSLWLFAVSVWSLAGAVGAFRYISQTTALTGAAEPVVAPGADLVFGAFIVWGLALATGLAAHGADAALVVLTGHRFGRFSQLPSGASASTETDGAGEAATQPARGSRSGVLPGAKPGVYAGGAPRRTDGEEEQRPGVRFERILGFRPTADGGGGWRLPSMEGRRPQAGWEIRAAARTFAGAREAVLTADAYGGHDEADVATSESASRESAGRPRVASTRAASTAVDALSNGAHATAPAAHPAAPRTRMRASRLLPAVHRTEFGAPEVVRVQLSSEDD